MDKETSPKNCGKENIKTKQDCRNAGVHERENKGRKWRHADRGKKSKKRTKKRKNKDCMNARRNERNLS
ncbi:MAG: hypothetical protein HZR80_04985 [Candidatus Heimdallarchaeota archaeon]